MKSPTRPLTNTKTAAPPATFTAVMGFPPRNFRPSLRSRQWRVGRLLGALAPAIKRATFSPALSREFRHGIVDPIERNGRRESVPLVIREEGNARTHSSSSMKLEPRYPALSPRGLGHRGS